MLDRRLPTTALPAALVLAVACGDANAPTAIDEPAPVTPPARPRFAVQQGIVANDLGSLSAVGFHVARAANIKGHVVGISTDDLGKYHAFYWTPTGGMVDLGTTGGDEAWGYDINDNDMIVGRSLDATGAAEAFTWTPAGGIQGLGQFGGLESAALGVNNNGQVVGHYAPPFDPLDPSTFRGIRGFVWSASSGFQELPTLGSLFEGFAFDINDQGEVVGISATADPLSPFLSYIWDPINGIRNLGSLGPDFSEHDALRINASGTIPGCAYNDVSGMWHPFVWSEQGGLVDLTTQGFPGTASGCAIDINVLGHLAMLMLQPDGNSKPAVWVPGTGLLELPTLGGTEGEIWTINDLGMIAGWSETATGGMRPTLWTLEFAPEDRIDDVMTQIQDILSDPATDPNVASDLQDAVSELVDALQELAENPPDGTGATSALADAVEAIVAAVAAGLDPNLGTALMEVLAEAARELAVEAIDAAIARNGDAGDIADAQQFLADGDTLRAAGSFEAAIDEYRTAINVANGA